jgi:hypothetical protein
MQMKGLAGLNGWRWIFIIEGLMTVLLGIAGYWLLVDFPDSKRQNWSFLGPREKEWYVLSTVGHPICSPLTHAPLGFALASMPTAATSSPSPSRWPSTCAPAPTGKSGPTP